MLEAPEARALQQLLVDLHGAADLPLLAVQVAEDHVDLERVRIERGGLAHLVDRQIELVADQEVEALHVVRRLALPAPVDPAAFLQLVALPGLAGGEADQQRDERREERASSRLLGGRSAVDGRSATSDGGPSGPARAARLRSARARRRRRRAAG